MLNKDPGTGAGAATVRPEDPAEDRTGKWRLRNWRLRYKMAAVLLVPTLAALGVGGVRVYDGLSTAGQLNTIVNEVALTQRTANLTHELQRERDYAVVRIRSGPGQADQYAAQAERVDQAIQQFKAFEEESEEFSPAVRKAYEDAKDRLNSLQALRKVVNDNFTSSQALVAYNSIVQSVLSIGHETAASAATTEVTQTARAAEALSQAKEQLAQQRSILLDASIRGEFLPEQVDALRDADARFEASFTEFERSATPQQRERYAAEVAGAEVDATEQLKQTALIHGGDDEPLDINPAHWGKVSGASADKVRAVEEQLLTDFHNDAQDLSDSAWWSAIRDAVLMLLLLVLAFGVAAYMARSMLRPLRTLRYSALEIAQESLPEAIEKVNENPRNARYVSVPPVPLDTQEELGQVARTFDAVHQQALRLAAEQALLRTNINDLFVNLARRSQTLVQRQLSLIDRLERDEQDPDQLSSLFELDHLATRMRRNNENLLILGGSDLSRRMTRPVPLNEVLGAAVSEVEQYARINVSDTPDLALQGRVVNDFVHLVAELLENATVFSNPDTEVNVRAAYRKQELVVEIRDRGVGMDEADLAEINDRLTKPPEIDVAVSRRMGLYVVSQLAQRHNIKVQLDNNRDLEGGVTATVYLSGEYVVQLTPEGPRPMPDMPASGEGAQAVTSTGNHVGLAAAFGQASSSALETRTEKTPLPERSREDAQQQSAEDGGENTAEAEEADFPADYSVTVSSGDSPSATDIPKWEDEQPAQESDEPPADAWPSDDIPEGLDGTCGVPEVGAETTGNLFQDPFETEKTTQLAAITDSGAPVTNGTPNASAAFPASEDTAENNQEKPQSGTTETWVPGGTSTSPAETTGEDSNEPPWDDTPTQRLPIYEAVLSQWFREADADDLGLATSSSEDGEREKSGQVDSTSEATTTKSTAPDPGWGSADVGWKAAEALLQQDNQPQELTAAGLPKRKPKSNLVPGSAAPSTQPTPRRKPATIRSAEEVRGRMSQFQQGIRRGRHAKVESVSAETPRPNPSRHEEQE